MCQCPNVNSSTLFIFDGNCWRKNAVNIESLLDWPCMWYNSEWICRGHKYATWTKWAISIWKVMFAFCTLYFRQVMFSLYFIYTACRVSYYCFRWQHTFYNRSFREALQTKPQPFKAVISLGFFAIWVGGRLVRFPDLLWEVGRENEPPESGFFFFRGLWRQKCCFYPPIQHT